MALLPSEYRSRKPDTVLDWSEFEQFEKDKDFENVYVSWLSWVERTQPIAMQIQNKKLIGIKGERAAMCSEESVATHFESLEKLLLEIRVLSKPGSPIQNAHRVWCVDEKGVTDDAGKLTFSRGLCMRSLGPPTRGAGQSSFKHIPVLPIICLDGSVSEPCKAAGRQESRAVFSLCSWLSPLSASGSVFTVHGFDLVFDLGFQGYGWQRRNACLEIRVGAGSRESERARGSHDRTVCNVFCSLCAVAAPQRIPLILDSGGGSVSHISVAVGQLAEKYRLRPWFLGPYHTAALCPLDQSPNCSFERRWSSIRAKASSFSPLQALDATHECFDFAYCTKNNQWGFRDIGLVPGHRVNRARVLLECGPKLFKKTVPEAQRDYETAEAQVVLDPPKGYTRAPESTRSIAEAVAKGGRAEGYKRKATPLVDMVDALDFSPKKKANVAKVRGDLVSKARQISSTSDAPAAAADSSKPEPAGKAPSNASAASKAVFKPAQQACAEVSAAPPQPAEYDLDSEQHCVEWLLAAFSEQRRDSVRHLAMYYAQHELKPCTKKQVPLSEVFRVRVIDVGLLKNNQRQTTWIQRVSQQRSKKYVGGPSVVWKQTA